MMSLHSATPSPASATPSHSATPSPASACGEALAAAAIAVATRIASGATLWAVAPGLDDHARHVAVEFLHPVVVGTRSVPAVALTGANLIGRARRGCRVGDVAVLVGPETAEFAARCRVWGVVTVALTWGDVAVARQATHVVRLGGEADAVRAYHLLWELTQVCLEHAGLLEAAPPGAMCAVCADDAVLGEVVDLCDDQVTLLTPCGIVTADATLVADLTVDDLVLVHAGIVIGRERIA